MQLYYIYNCLCNNLSTYVASLYFWYLRYSSYVVNLPHRTLLLKTIIKSKTKLYDKSK